MIVESFEILEILSIKRAPLEMTPVDEEETMSM